MKFNIKGVEVEIRVNGKVQKKTVKKAKLSDQNMKINETIKRVLRIENK